MKRVLFSLALSSCLAISVAGPALAHAHLLSATPGMNTKVDKAPAELDLAFSEGVDLAFTGVVVTGPDKIAVPTGPAQQGHDGPKTLVVPLLASLPPGLYEVAWHALAVDGHKTEGRYSFSVSP